MRKLLLAIFTLLFVYSNAQDTIIFKNNPAPVVCTIRSITETNIFYISNGEYLSDYVSNVKYCSKPIPKAPLQYTQPTQTQVAPIASHAVTPPSGYIALSIGPGFPFGNYRDSGFASTGVNLSLTAAKPFSGSVLGTILKLDYGYNSVDRTALLTYFQNSIPYSNATLSINSVGNFSFTSVLAGFNVLIPGKDMSFELRALGGLMFASTPAINIGLYEYNSSVGEVSEGASSATALCLNFGAGLHYKITPEISAVVFFDFEYANPTFSVTTTAVVQTSSGTAVIPLSGSANQVFETGNLTFGFAWTPVKNRPK